MAADKPQRAGSVRTFAAPPVPLEPLPEVRESPARSIKRVLTADLQIEEDEMKRSRKAVKEALRVLEYHDSTFHDQFTAARILTFVTLEHHRSSRLAWWISIFLFACILLNAGSFLAGTIKSTMIKPRSCPNPVCVPGDGAPCTVPVCEPEENPIIWQIEMYTIIIFTVDYLLRVLTVHAVPADLAFHRSLEYTMDGRLKDRSTRTQSGCGKTVKYMSSPINIIDLVSILPYYVLLIMDKLKAVPGSVEILRMFRFLRFLLIFKLGRRFRLGGVIIGRTLRASTPALIIFLFLTVILAITFGSVMYFFEGGMFQVTQQFPAGGFLRPNARNTALEMSPFVSIFTGIYWYVVNTTTLGNAALYPTTTGGRIFSCVVAYIGLATLALPISIIGKNFSEQYDLVYATVPQAQKSLAAFGAMPQTTPANGKPGQKMGPRAMTPSMKALSQMVGGDKGAFFNAGGSSAEQEVEALRTHFQAQIDGLRAQLEEAAAANSAGSGAWEAAAPMHEELEALRSFVEKEISGLKQNMTAASALPAAGSGNRAAFTPPLSDDETGSGNDSVIRPRGLQGMGSSMGMGMGQQQAAAVPTPAPIVLGSYSAAVTAALAQAAQNDPDDDEDYYGEEERKYQSAREALRQQELHRFRSQMAERGRRMSGSFTPQQELRTYGGASGLM